MNHCRDCKYSRERNVKYDGKLRLECHLAVIDKDALIGNFTNDYGELGILPVSPEFGCNQFKEKP